MKRPTFCIWEERIRTQNMIVGWDSCSNLNSVCPGNIKILQLIQAHFYWPTWQKDVEQYVQSCFKCKHAWNPKDKTSELFQSLPVSEQSWQRIAIDIRSFSKNKKSYDTAFMIVDQFSKRSISISCFKTTEAEDMTWLFVKNVYHHQEPSVTIVSDRDPQFISAFWNELCRILGVELKL